MNNTRVKLFRHGDLSDVTKLENDINEWIEKTPLHSIQDIQISANDYGVYAIVKYSKLSR